ncbi:MAG TPA: hypothetical protein PLY91_07925 [Methanoregulaceae archaeon]|nr:hypothetical protein [Methanoregulaceae archaeon]
MTPPEPVAMTEYEARAAAHDFGIGPYAKALTATMVACGAWKIVSSEERS